MLNDHLDLDATFLALADPTRRGLVERLARGPASVSDLARPLPMSLPAVMQHIAVLESAGLVRSEKIGRVRTCRLEAARLSEVEAWIGRQRQEWNARLADWSPIWKTIPRRRPMTAPIETTETPVTRLTRLIRAPRAVVFAAWTRAEHLRQWFSPAIFTVPEAIVEPRPGGVFAICMRAPDGTDYWARGTFTAVSPVDHLAITMETRDAADATIFLAYTDVTFSEVADGTQLDVVQRYEVHQPEMAAPMLRGAPLGWSQTVDKLEIEVARMVRDGERGWSDAEKRVAAEAARPTPNVRSVAHGLFHVDRTVNATPARVYAAFTDEGAKAKWFAAPSGQWSTIERTMDVRVGGRERLRGLWANGTITDFDATYLDLVPDARLVYTYTMHVDERKISVSLATIEMTAIAPGKTKLRVTEQGAFLDGYDDAGAREHGTNLLIDRLVESLA